MYEHKKKYNKYNYHDLTQIINNSRHFEPNRVIFNVTYKHN